jgi:hypothetical protein
MLAHLKRTILALAIAGAACSAPAFSMLGPFDTWQVPGIGYNPPVGGDDIGGPMNLGEEYRWNIKTIYYACDESLISYFGAQGTNAIAQAIAILNGVTNASKMSSDLSEFPMSTRRMNYTASALNLIDLKSSALGAMMEEMGLASPERYVWCLRDRVTFTNPDHTNYTVIKRNFDPVTLAPSSFVNGTLYTYSIAEFKDPDWSDAVEVQVDPLQYGFTAVASSVDGLFGGGLEFGEYFTGLTRDDMGGLKRLFNTNLYHVETLLPGTTGSSSGDPWGTPGGGTTNTAVDQAVRPGVDKVVFKTARYDSLIGSFIAITNVWTDKYVLNGELEEQTVQRVLLTAPDVLFAADDLPVLDGVPTVLSRTETAGWINNDAINGSTTLIGPGVITGPVQIIFNKVGPFYINQFPFFLDEFNLASPGWTWGSFDGTTNAPVVYPIGTSIEEMQAQVLYGVGDANGQAWTVSDSLSVITNGTAAVP